MNSIDWWTQTIDKVTDLFLLNSPNRTGFGAAIGIALHVVVLIFKPSLQNLSYFNVTEVPLWGWSVLGIVAMNARTIRATFKEESVGNEQIDLAIKLIKAAKLSPAAERHEYVLLIRKIVETMSLEAKRTAGLHAQ